MDVGDDHGLLGPGPESAGWSLPRRAAEVAVDLSDADLLTAIDLVLARFEEELMPPAQPGEERFWGWHPLHLPLFAAGLGVARAALGPGAWRFLDVGSGLGTKMAVAAWLGWKAAGVERHPPYAQVSRRLWPILEVAVVDAWDYDGYGAADVIYSYRLCKAEEDQAALVKHVVSRARPGTLLFLAGSVPEGLEALGSGVWRV